MARAFFDPNSRAESASGPQKAAHYSDFLRGIKKAGGYKFALWRSHLSLLTLRHTLASDPAKEPSRSMRLNGAVQRALQFLASGAFGHFQAAH